MLQLYQFSRDKFAQESGVYLLFLGSICFLNWSVVFNCFCSIGFLHAYLIIDKHLLNQPLYEGIRIDSAI